MARLIYTRDKNGALIETREGEEVPQAPPEEEETPVRSRFRRQAEIIEALWEPEEAPEEEPEDDSN